MTVKQRVPPAIEELYNRRLSAAELSRMLMPVTDEEVASTMELVRWFRRRYPTAKERLAYVRRAYERWASGPTLTVTARTR
ncbi:MAG: hypothetical protein KF819_03415 [Labilithrix sp.]|nr:hypothetical protein [Labilithrix sp.]